MDPLWLDSAHGFTAELSVRTLGDLHLSTVHAHGHSVVRTPAMIGPGSSDDLFQCVVTHGPGMVRQSDRTVQVDKGDIVVVDAARPYRFDFPTEFNQVVVQIPRALAVGRAG